MHLSTATRKLIMLTIKIVLIVYILLCTILYFFQEKLIFLPVKLDKRHTFTFNQPFEEWMIPVSADKNLHGILFKADSSKGLIFYLHGNAGSLDSWGAVAEYYRGLQYDVFMPDYRGYGKSEGSISSEQQLHDDVQSAYDEMKKRYAENKIVVIGYSIGSGMASKLASANQPRLLVLQAPYYSLTDMMRRYYRIIPAFLLKYKLENYRHIPACRMPVVVFHSKNDEVIYYQSSVKLKQVFKPGDTLITLTRLRHNGMTDDPTYRLEMEKLLN